MPRSILTGPNFSARMSLFKKGTKGMYSKDNFKTNYYKYRMYPLTPKDPFVKFLASGTSNVVNALRIIGKL